VDVLADVLQDFVKLGSMNALRLKIDTYILDEFFEIRILLTKFIYRFPVKEGPAAGRKENLRAVDVFKIELDDSNTKGRGKAGQLGHQFVVLLDVRGHQIAFVSPR
jgi:hypothetical protein